MELRLIRVTECEDNNYKNQKKTIFNFFIAILGNQEAQLTQIGRTTLGVVEILLSLKVIRIHTAV